MVSSQTVIEELETALVHGAGRRRADMLRDLTDLFTEAPERYSEAEIALFDDVIGRLAADIEASARVLLAERLAHVPNAPPKVIRLLAGDDAIEVAWPILAYSEKVDEPLLIDTARMKSQRHLYAISRRKSLSEAVTDVLVERGDQDVLVSVVENAGAQFSEWGFSGLVKRSDQDDRLAISVSARSDLPLHLFLKLLATASEAVRVKLQAEHPRAKREVHQVVTAATERLHAEARNRSLDYANAQSVVNELRASGLLNSEKIGYFATNRRFEDTVAALALISEMPVDAVERAMTSDRPEMLLILAKGVGLSWTATKAVLSLWAGKGGMSINDVEQCLGKFERLKPATAQQLLRFHRVREGSGPKA